MVKTYYVDEAHTLEKYSSKAFNAYFGDADICVLDIETTGTAPTTARFVLGGLLSINDGGEARLKQYFAEDISEEKRLLTEYIEEASKHDIILTYNGRRFDVPFLLSRADKLEVDVIDLPYNLDLYLVLNGHSALRKLLPNLKQKTIEDFMGLWPYRADKISGAESAYLYQKYIYLKENFEDTESCVELMTLHNRDDVLQLARLLPVLEKCDFHKAMYTLGFPVNARGAKALVESIAFEGNRLTVSGSQMTAPLDFISYVGDCAVRFEKKRAAFEIRFPVFKKSGAVVLDLLKLPVDISAGLSSLPDYESGYLILKNSGEIKHSEINCFIRAFLLELYRRILHEE